MNPDILELLRHGYVGHYGTWHFPDWLHQAAAVEIERLRRELEQTSS